VTSSQQMQKKILVVEDDKYIRETIIELLESEGYLTAPAADGREALDHLEKPDSKLPDVILLDLAMPGMDGFAFRAEQKKYPRFAAIPIIVMSAENNVESKRHRIGAVDFVKKPASIDVLLAAIKRSCK
jgi:two-component system chemotaxis response regulator CheY